MIDWSRVRELREEIGAEDFEEVVELFLDEVEEVVERLNTTPDLTSLEADLHFLKGSALSFGFVDFSGKCQDGERDSAAGRAGDVNIGDVVDGYYQAKQVFLTEMPLHLGA
ncbi:MAG: Hpt domain-containing protein [Paracoccaceae bacterium]